MKTIIALLWAINVAAAPASAPITVRVAQDATTLDWNRASDAPSALIILQIMHGLFRVNPDNTVTPDLATAGDLSGTTSVIKIHDGISWSDGRALRAQDFVDSFNRLRDPKTGSAVANFLDPISEMHATGNLILTVTLKKRIAYLDKLLSHPCLFPIRKDLIDKYGDAWTDPKNLVVLGPYKIESRRVDSITKLRPIGDVQPVDVRVIESDGTAQDLFESGQLDIDLGVSPAAARKADHLDATLVNRVVGVLLNPKKLNDKMRSQFASNIDRAAIVKALGHNRVATASWVSPDLIHASKIEATTVGTTLQPTKAVLNFASRDDYKMIAEILQQQLKLHELQPVDFKTYLQKVKTGDYEITLFAWNAGFPDAINFLEVFTTDGIVKYSNLAYDKLVEQIASSPKGRDQAIRDAQDILVNKQHVIIPLYQDVQLALVNPKVKGYALSNGYLHFSELKKAY